MLGGLGRSDNQGKLEIERDRDGVFLAKSCIARCMGKVHL